MASFKRLFPQSPAHFRIKSVTSCATENHFLPRDGGRTVRIKLFYSNFSTQQKYCKNKTSLFRSLQIIWKYCKLKTMIVSLDLFVCLSLWTIDQIVNNQIVSQTFFFIVLIKRIHLTNKKIHNMKEENKQCTLLFWLIIDQTKIYNTFCFLIRWNFTLEDLFRRAVWHIFNI